MIDTYFFIEEIIEHISARANALQWQNVRSRNDIMLSSILFDCGFNINDNH